MPPYIRLDRQSDALASLEEFCRCVERASTDELAWKYAIISMHGALQGYMCIALKNGNSLVHFNTDSFGIHRESAIVVCREALKAVKVAPERASGIFFYSEEQSKKFKEACKRAENVLDSISKRA